MDILGTRVDFFSKEAVLKIISSVIFRAQSSLESGSASRGTPPGWKRDKTHPFFIVTANSEFILKAQSDPHFRDILKKADLVLPDGVSLLQARDFISKFSPRLLGGVTKGFFLALKIFFKTLRGGYADKTVTGVDIVRFFLEGKSSSDGGSLLNRGTSPMWTRPKIFLLGGHNHVAQKIAEKYALDYMEGSIDITKITQQKNQAIIKRIHDVLPDVLFVSFGHFRQEEWIYKNLSKLSCKVVIGVGSAFDEITGIGIWAGGVPSFFQAIGLKWLWRFFKNPAHFSRVWQAVIIFPLKIYKAMLK